MPKTIGRPRHGERVKTAPLNMRTAQDLRDKLVAAASANGHSLTQEVEYRMRRSFEVDDVLRSIGGMLGGQSS